MPPADPHDELLEIADRLNELAEKGTAPEIKDSLKRLEDAATRVAKSWSGSHLGYHARVYYKDFSPPPAGANFSPEWGLQESWPIKATTGDWLEYDPAYVVATIRRAAGDPDLAPARRLAAEAQALFETSKPDLLSILATSLTERADSFLTSLKEQIEQTVIIPKDAVLRRLLPSRQFVSRDSLAGSQGFQPPPHLSTLSEVVALGHAPAACDHLAQLARRAGSHLARQRRRSRRAQEVGTNVFIGHGKSLMWRELKDFVQDRLHLPWDEFNRVPVAGVTNIARLSEMLDAAVIAFLIMTGEDERADGKLQARMNVVHEAGLFQGRLGFTKAIVLLEEGCEEFTNIAGLGQIRFPKGNIKAVFDEVRRVLEREGIIQA
jgi:predicted nucleotide-binding protein